MRPPSPPEGATNPESSSRLPLLLPTTLPLLLPPPLPLAPLLLPLGATPESSEPPDELPLGLPDELPLDEPPLLLPEAVPPASA